ncbi:hypothetical protein L2Z53_03755 [Macrococcoides canis]|uniref:hypothetical protein n=1 Tax=Macrococcoides canis TaxID=1855823 RepID=UPI001F42A2E7|nr:hypothetical protein [Macrococcus canis]UJS28472.1 hypothetical protein L2Z53_03755 [Macrococcus canis]
MLKEAMEWIRANTASVEMLKINGQEYSNRELYKLQEPVRRELNVTTLTGLVDYIKSAFDGNEKYIITVLSESYVIIESKLNSNKRREIIVTSNAQIPKVTLNEFIDLEKFNIQLQSVFVPNEERATVLSLIGNIKTENVSNTGDDGISQMVEVKRGVTTVKKEEVPNPVYLKPFRTFTEISQPESAFVLRIKESASYGLQAALFEADGGAWKNEAILNIKEYLEEELKDHTERITILA